MGKDRKRRGRKKKPTQTQPKGQVGGPIDYHHLLYQRRHWLKPWARRLREHPYMGKRIPMNTLHRRIHDTIHDIPVPNEDVCEATVAELERLRGEGLIDVKHDSLEARLDFLIAFWGEREGLDATVAVLKWQRQIVHKFYQAPH